MLDLLKADPWLIPVILGLLIPILGIIFGTISKYMVRVRQAELDASLKQEMLQRGMSAEEIKTVIEAASPGKAKRWTEVVHAAVQAKLAQQAGTHKPDARKAF